MAKKKEIEIVNDGTPSNDMSPEARRLMELTNGAEPIDDDEIQMVKEIQEIKDKGREVWIPSD